MINKWHSLSVQEKRYIQFHLLMQGTFFALFIIYLKWANGWPGSLVASSRQWSWLWFLVGQATLSAITALLVHIVIAKNIARPILKLRETISAIQRDSGLEPRANADADNAGIGGIAWTFNTLAEKLIAANKQLNLFSQVFENSGEAILITDAGRNIVAVNRAFTTITGYQPGEVIGKNPKLLSSGRHTAEFYQAMWQSINETGQWRGEIWNRRKNGKIYPEWLSITAVKGNQSQVINYIAIFIDITQRKETEQYIEFLAYYDSLTKLPNRRLFEDRIQQALMTSKREHKKAAILFLDIDRFKNINDSLGHHSGDLLLQSVTERLKSCIRETDTMCRQGGDEFIIVLPEINKLKDAEIIATKIIAAMSEVHFIKNYQITVTFSIGISIFPDDGVDSQTLIKNADAAMYYAKRKGRDNFQFFTPDMGSKALERLALEADLRKAIQQNEFTLLYQPQIDNYSGSISGIEALIRWQHPELGWISPAKFIPIAEECGQIKQIGEWVLKTACLQNKKWQDDKLLVVPIAINISALQFHQKDFKDTIAEALHMSSLESKYLELEITEGAAMQEFKATIFMLNELKQIGVLISIDDFGTGYSSLNYLKRFPIDKLKIDQSFVRDITTNVDDAAIVKTIIGIGHSLRLKVIGEGVETADQLAFLKDNGCDEIQGYYFTKPISADDFGKFVVSYTPEKIGNPPACSDGRLSAVSEINNQHQSLMDMVDRMDKAMNDGQSIELFAKMLDELITHTQSHFVAEEKLMNRFDYPQQDSHRKEHRTLIEEIHLFKGKLGEKVEPMLPRFIRNWLLAHIEKTDKPMIEHVAGSRLK